MITKLDDLLELVKSKGKKRLVAAYANDSHTISAVSAAIDRGRSSRKLSSLFPAPGIP